MQKLTDRHGFVPTDAALRFAIVRLRSRPETDALVAPAKAVRGTLRARWDAYQDAVDERLAQSAELIYRDGKLDQAVVHGLKRDAAATFNDHAEGAALQRRLFQGQAPSEGMKPVAGEQQESFVNGILQRLEKDADFRDLKSHAKKLRDLQSGVDETLDKRKKARVKERLAQSDLDETLDEAHAFYNQLYPRLQLIFSKDVALVESYFLDLRSSASAAADTGTTDGDDATPASKPTEPS